MLSLHETVVYPHVWVYDSCKQGHTDRF